MQTAEQLLESLNNKYIKLHKKYEDLFWVSYMGDRSVDIEKDKAMAKRDAFFSDSSYSDKIREYIPKANAKEKKHLKNWLDFFSYYQALPEALHLKQKINNLESSILKGRSERKEGYIDPFTKKFVAASEVKMVSMIATDPDENVRKACFDAREKLALDYVTEYVQLIHLRNEYARLLGFEDFYDFKVRREDGMTKKELFSIFDSIYEKTKYASKKIEDLEKEMPGVLKPWNFLYMMRGNFALEEDPYFSFEDALMRWGRSFSALGIDFKGSKMKLDLLDRKGKWNNGFCHWPQVVSYKNGKRISGTTNFTCTVVPGQVGSGKQGFVTLFHEGGHAAHFLNTDQKDVCLNSEYLPMSASWAETQSMFLDEMFSSIEWKVRYARDKDGNPFPFSLYEKEATKIHSLYPLSLNRIIYVANFEKEIYEEKDLTPEKVIHIARRNFRKYNVRTEDSLALLCVPHIYSWDSSGSYHGYALATLALHQWREYFYKKYGHIVDNPKVGKEMTKLWKLGSSEKFNNFVKLATGKKLSPDAFLRKVTKTLPEILKDGHEKITKLEKVKVFSKNINMNAVIQMVHGKEVIATNKKSFEDMAQNYENWIRKMSS